MTPSEEALLAQIESLAIDPPGAALSFVARLARENGWSLAHAHRVDREYRRFLFLAATAPHPVTPSDAVDQAWHLHLAYTRSYWEDLCGAILGRPLHHGPTAGGGAEDQRYRAQYAATLDRYRNAFGTPPPRDIWPSLAERFIGRFVRVDRSRTWIVPRAPLAPVVVLPMLAGCAVLAANSAGDGGDNRWITYGLWLLLAAGLLVAIMRESRRSRNRKDKDGGGCGTGCETSPDSSSDGCGGGCGGD